MANSFENFIQLELPKRPYMAEDVPQESVILRRGAGPRQLGGLSLAEGHIPMMVNGKLTSVPAPSGSGGANGYSFAANTPAATWTIEHGKGSTNAVVTLLDTDMREILCDDLVIEENTITVTFVSPQAGFANIVFF
tara:strand:+ start:24247 stop:24654 length:408 start_codon:yes stop_codon:yes gene_type:complete